MTTPQVNGELFTQNATEVLTILPLREFDPSSAEGELRLRIQEVEASVAALDEAQIVTQELLEKVISF